MSTRGCIGIRTGGVTHFVFHRHDSHPSCLGQELVSQIECADLSCWKCYAHRMRVTDRWYGPDFALSPNEIAATTEWLEGNTAITMCVNPDVEAEGENLISVPDDCCERDTIATGMEFATLVRTTLHNDPAIFFGFLCPKIGALLHLGLLPRVSPAFVTSPFCEWVYLIDLDDDLFTVGHGEAPPSARGSQLNAIWKPALDCTIVTYASFSLTAIPLDWEEQVMSRRHSRTRTFKDVRLCCSSGEVVRLYTPQFVGLQ
jgi:hypothetical protein